MQSAIARRRTAYHPTGEYPWVVPKDNLALEMGKGLADLILQGQGYQEGDLMIIEERHFKNTPAEPGKGMTI